MHNHAIKARFFGVTGRLRIIGHNASDFFAAYCPRGWKRPFRTQLVNMPFASYGTRRNRNLSAQKLGVGNSPNVPKLYKNFAAVAVHGFGNALPAINLCLAPKTRGIAITYAPRRYGCALDRT